MKDKGLVVFLMLLFGMGGIAILLLAWTTTMSLPERILATCFGLVGLVWVLVKMPWLSAHKQQNLDEKRLI